ncbi:hypothetical protein [Oleiharenicola lentus]|uniref:hypothetical protein n=1 Tax=Oleiharenicola lentus TaxID=2508720 RepID=UPI003F66C5BA
MSTSAIVVVSPPLILEQLGFNLAAYGRVAGLTGEQVLIKKGEDLAYRAPGGNSLAALFRARAPHAQKITEAAIARGFTLGRRNGNHKDGITGVAAARAQSIMGGFKSILANVSLFEGRLQIRGVRVSTAGRRIAGGRRGTGGFAVPGSLATNAEREILFPGVYKDTDKRMNFRAVSTVFEINLRGAASGFMSAAWLMKRIRRLKDSRRIELVNPRSQVAPLLSRAALEGSGESGSVAVRLSSFVPGSLEVGNRRGIFAHALAALSADIGSYLARKESEALKATLRNGMEAGRTIAEAINV